MKEQYFVDRRDYFKFSILRHLLEQGLSCTVCWIMTPNDDTGQGAQTGYLKQRGLWQHHDSAVFDYLREQYRGSRDIFSIENQHISPIARCRFYWDQFPESSTRKWEEHFTYRRRYFDGCLSKAAGTDLVFLDPDTGPEPNKPVLTDLDKYVLWDEITRIFYAGHSVMAFGFLRGATTRKETLAAERLNLLRDRLPAAEVAALRTHDLVFYFAAHEMHSDDVRCARKAILEVWGPERLWQAI